MYFLNFIMKCFVKERSSAHPTECSAGGEFEADSCHFGGRPAKIRPFLAALPVGLVLIMPRVTWYAS